MRFLNALRFVLLTMLPLSMQAQSSRVLFTVGGDPVTVEEFEYVYTKNNFNNQSDYSEKSLREYLKLYENFRLKVKEAEAQKLDTISSLIRELAGYRKQLAETYIYDKTITDRLMEEAYARMQKNLHVSHILIEVDIAANPKDSLEAYQKIMDIRKRLMKGENFGKLAKEFSNDPSAKENGGDIGWITAFTTVYPFETKAFSLKKGEISGPVRTNFGYHLIRLNDLRDDPGEYTVAHIMMRVADTATAQQKAAVGKRMDSVYTLLSSGAMPFDSAVVRFSEDRASRSKKGEIPPFTSGRMVPEFETAAFQLKNDGEISKPVLSPFGWHIIRRISVKKLGSYGDMKNDIKKRVERDTRSQVAQEILFENIKKEYQFSEDLKALKAVSSRIDTSLNSGNWKATPGSSFSERLFTLAGRNYTAAELVAYMEKNSRTRPDKEKDELVEEYYDNWKKQCMKEYEETQLDRKKPEFRNLMKEYRDGVLIFELTDREVWGKAVKDTLGLQRYHSEFARKYMWGQRVDATVYNATDIKLAEMARKMLSKGKTVSEVEAKINKAGTKGKLSSFNGKYEKGQYDVVDKVNWQPGLSPLEKLNDSTYRWVQINRLVEPEPKLLKEAKGYIVSDYQEYLEKNWLAALRNRYPIVLNEEVLKSLIKK